MNEKKVVTSLVVFDDLDLKEAISHIINLKSQSSFSYVVTPNIDHMARLCNAQSSYEIKKAYQQANLTLCDSRILDKLLRFSRKPVKAVVPGSDLTQHLFDCALTPDDKVVVLGCADQEMTLLYKKYPSLNITHINPSMGFIKKEHEVLSLIDRLKEEEADYLFLAVGSPQQEIFANKLKEAGLKKGVALCVGASINFIVGVEQRAPLWMQHLHLEWFYRMLQNPLRLAKRYTGNACDLPRIYYHLRH